MYIVGSNGLVVDVSEDNRLHVFAINEPYLHAMTRAGRAWSITGTYTSSTVDNAFFHFLNTSPNDIMIHAIKVSAASPGLAALEYGRTWVSGGTLRTTVAQLQTLSAQAPSITTYGGAVLTLAGTATDVVIQRCPTDSGVDLLLEKESFEIFAGGSMALRFKADAGTPVVTYTILMHGAEPWGD